MPNIVYVYSSFQLQALTIPGQIYATGQVPIMVVKTLKVKRSYRDDNFGVAYAMGTESTFVASIGFGLLDFYHTVFPCLNTLFSRCGSDKEEQPWINPRFDPVETTRLCARTFSLPASSLLHMP